MKQRWTIIFAVGAVLIALASPARAALVFESATLGPVGQMAGVTANSSQWLGVRFTLTASTQVTWLGAHYWMNGTDGFIGVFPIESGTGFPPEPPALADALATAALPAQSTSAETGVAVDITLPAGDYAVVLGSTSSMSTGGMPVNNPNINTPFYVVKAGSGWLNGGLNQARFFVGSSTCGDGLVEPPEQCEDQNQDNTDACLNTCQDASCGDGFVHSGVEECDEGDQNGLGDCSLTCTLDPGQGGGGQGGSQGGSGTGGNGPGGSGGAASGGTGGAGGSANGGGSDVGEDSGCGCRVTGGQRPSGSSFPWTMALAIVSAPLLRRASIRRRRHQVG
ncbi:MAG: DUF4215 domain-containing protein [Deltaproteobacteria bacterium]|nr:DUF4215 domain-containing protein [Deltaproteobacteria bacterium]